MNNSSWTNSNTDRVELLLVYHIYLRTTFLKFHTFKPTLKKYISKFKKLALNAFNLI